MLKLFKDKIKALSFYMAKYLRLHLLSVISNDSNRMEYPTVCCKWYQFIAPHSIAPKIELFVFDKYFKQATFFKSNLDMIYYLSFWKHLVVFLNLNISTKIQLIFGYRSK